MARHPRLEELREGLGAIMRSPQNDGILKIPPGPNGPVGSIWIALDKPTYGIHGTPDPAKIGKTESHGCVRLYPENIELLYSLVSIGEKVNIINEPYLAGWRNGELYFESHRPLEDDAVPPEERLLATVKAHVSRLFDKLQVTNRVQIAICVHDAGLS